MIIKKYESIDSIKNLKDENPLLTVINSLFFYKDEKLEEDELTILDLKEPFLVNTVPNSDEVILEDNKLFIGEKITESSLKLKLPLYPGWIIFLYKTHQKGNNRVLNNVFKSFVNKYNRNVNIVQEIFSKNETNTNINETFNVNNSAVATVLALSDFKNIFVQLGILNFDYLSNDNDVENNEMYNYLTDSEKISYTTLKELNYKLNDKDKIISEIIYKIKLNNVEEK